MNNQNINIKLIKNKEKVNKLYERVMVKINRWLKNKDSDLILMYKPNTLFTRYTKDEVVETVSMIQQKLGNQYIVGNFYDAGIYSLQNYSIFIQIKKQIII